jgi:tetratricopeptide (TPR) repeat protein
MVLALGATLAGTALAQTGRSGQPNPADEDQFAPPPEEELATPRKEPSMFMRPGAKTPALQLERARKFESRGKRSSALDAYQDLIHTWHNAPEALPAQQAIARLYEQRKRYERAFLEYQYLLVHFSGRCPYREIVERQYALANHLDAPRRNFLGLQMNSAEESRRRYEQIARNAPNWIRTPDVLLKVGACFESDEELPAAADVYARLQARYPASSAAPLAARREVECRYSLSIRYPKDDALCSKAITAADAALQAYPTHPDRAQFAAWREELGDRQADSVYQRAVFYDTFRKQPQAALVAYREFLRQFPGSKRVAAVRERIRQLEAETNRPTAKP